MKNELMGAAAVTVAGMALGAAAVYLATQDHRSIRRCIHRTARGAERTMMALDKMMESNFG